MALGAAPARVRGMVLSQVAWMTLIGGVVGLAGAVALAAGRLAVVRDEGDRSDGAARRRSRCPSWRSWPDYSGPPRVAGRSDARASGPVDRQRRRCRMLRRRRESSAIGVAVSQRRSSSSVWFRRRPSPVCLCRLSPPGCRLSSPWRPDVPVGSFGSLPSRRFPSRPTSIPLVLPFGTSLVLRSRNARVAHSALLSEGLRPSDSPQPHSLA